MSEPSRPMLAIVGAGTYGSVIKELAEACGYRVAGFLDDRADAWGCDLDGLAVSGPIFEAMDGLPLGCQVAVAVGNNAVRLRILRETRNRGRGVPALISPHAIVSPSAEINEAVYLHPNSHVWTQAQLGVGVILSPHATVAHHTVLRDGCFVSTGANVGASIDVGECAMFGIGSTTSTGVRRIGAHSLVGAGAVIVRDTQDYGVYVGIPGRMIRVRSE